MSVENYWMGKDLDLESLWRDFDAGSGYIHKVSGSSLHVVRLTFDGRSVRLPLFDHEVLFKTVKGLPRCKGGVPDPIGIRPGGTDLSSSCGPRVGDLRVPRAIRSLDRLGCGAGRGGQVVSEFADSWSGTR